MGSPTTSIFINGTPISSQDMLTVLSDLDHVEVLKGPQSAYFGRETFAGAVNVVTAVPKNEWNANLNVGLGTRDNKNIYGSFGGPIIPEKLSFTAGANYVGHSGSYHNAENPSQTLGDQLTKSAHLGVLFTPIENLSIRYYGLWLQDRDGPAATGLILATSPFSQSNCKVNNVAFFCGTLPSLNTAQSPAQNTTLSAAANTFLHSGALGGVLNPSEVIKSFGLHRDADHHDLTVQYEAPSVGLTFTYLVGYNSDQWSEISDLSNLDGAAGGQYPGYPGFPYLVEGISHDISHEFRVATDPNKRYRATVGLSYVDQINNGALNAPVVALVPNGETESITKGVFFGLAYDILPQLTLSFDGRYQSDEERSFTNAGAVAFQGTSDDFLPRVSLQYRFTPDVMAYFTYSKGVNPGLFNSVISTLPAVSIAEMRSAGLNPQVQVSPEYLTNYEIGFKGRFLDGRATVSVDVYWDKWTNQLNPESYVFLQNDPSNPFNVVGSPTFRNGQKSADPISFQDNSAATTPKGIEFEGNLIPVEHVTLNLGAAYNSTKYTTFNCTNCSPYASFNASGKYLPFAPLFSATAGVQYANKADVYGVLSDWYVRADYVYRDGVNIQPSNTVKTPDINLLNLRAGLTRGRFGIDAYVNNVTNNKSYVTGFNNYDFTTFAHTAVMVGLPTLITAGVDLKFKY